MSLQRKAIREAIVSTLKNQTDCLERVYPNRVIPSWVSELPLILVFTNVEDSEVFIESPRTFRRKLIINVELLSDQLDQIDNDLDVMASQIEYALNQDHTLGGLCEDIFLQSSNIEIRENGAKLFGSNIISYLCHYYAEATADRQFLRNLNGVDVEYHLEDGTSGIDAEDLLTGLQA